jgi:hypothetical protein
MEFKININGKQKRLFSLFKETSQFFVKMSIQSWKFCKYNMSITIVSAMYAALTHIENSTKKDLKSQQIVEFCD